MKKLFAALVSFSLAMVCSSCSSGNAGGSSSSSGGSSTSTVLAQTTYSTASLSGTYSINWVNIMNLDRDNLGGFYSAVGTLQFNGSGGVSGGTLNTYSASATSGVPSPCAYSVTGTYSLQSTALGTATLNLTSTQTGCTAKPTWQVALAAADGGISVKLARTDPNAVATGSATKQ